ncbi:MAG: hypothetical protein ACTHPD_12675 [Rhizomicrobium sp.]
MPSTFEHPSGSASRKAAEQISTMCTIAISDIRDLRPDPGTMGTIGPTPLTMADAGTWLRSGFQTLNAAHGIEVVNNPRTAPISLSIDLLKAYVMNVTTETRTVNIVMRVRYDGKGGPAERIYRGTTNHLTWFSAEKESYGSFNAALQQVLDAIANDIHARC